MIFFQVAYFAPKLVEHVMEGTKFVHWNARIGLMMSFVKMLLKKENAMTMKCFITVPKPAQTALRASLSLVTKILCELIYKKLCSCFQDDQNSKFTDKILTCIFYFLIRCWNWNRQFYRGIPFFPLIFHFYYPSFIIFAYSIRISLFIPSKGRNKIFSWH